MAVNFFVSFVCFLVLIAFGYAQDLSCYDCDPRTSAIECENPAANNARVSFCPRADNATSICYSAYLNYTDTNNGTNNTGIYRGCKILWGGVRDFCDWFQEEQQGVNLTIPSCIACTTSTCNTVKFNPDGTSAASQTSPVVILGLNCLFVLFIGLLH